MLTHMKHLGICAQCRMGKDTVADMIIDAMPRFEKKAFSEELKSLISNYFDLTLNEIEEYKVQECNVPNCHMNMRQILQTVGQAMRNVSNDVWINQTFKKIKEERVIFTDVRYKNEMQKVVSFGTMLILVGRTEYLNDDPHESEKTVHAAISWFLGNTRDDLIVVDEVKDVPEDFRCFTFFVRNDGSLNDLRVVVKKILEKIS